jgi:hypothetical protein
VGADLLATLTKNQTEPENAISRPLHFQALNASEMGSTSLCLIGLWTNLQPQISILMILNLRAQVQCAAIVACRPVSSLLTVIASLVKGDSSCQITLYTKLHKNFYILTLRQ